MVCEIVKWHLGISKIPIHSKVEAQTVSCVVEPFINKEKNYDQVNVFDQVTSAIMAKEQYKDLVLGLVYQNVLAGDKLKLVDVAKVKFNVAHKYLLHSDQLSLKKGVLRHLYIHCDGKYHQVILPDML